MREAEERLRKAQREGAIQEQEKALEELRQAKKELEEILRQLREEEIRRLLAVLEARFKKMLQMQREVYEGTVQLDQVPEWERTYSHEIQSSRLSSKELEIVLEADKALALLKEDGTAVAFIEATTQVREDMRQVADRLAQFKVNQITQQIELDIIAALEEMIEALQKAQKERQQQQQGGQQGQQGGQQQDPALVDLIAELKMIKAMQLRVNNRTERYRRLVNSDQSTEIPELQAALKKLAEQEQRIHKITRDIETGRNR
jgi:hypothetical protein